MKIRFDEKNNRPLAERLSIPQFRLPMILFMFTWPIAWFAFLIYGLGPIFFRAYGSISTWVIILISLLGNGAEMAVALIIFRREGYRLTLSSLRERINWRWPKGWKAWGAFLLVFLLAFSVAMLLGSTGENIAKVTSIPDWMPGHPLKEIDSLQAGYPDIKFEGNWLFFIIQNFVVVIIFNMFGEELYYRAALQPKMRGVFGNWDWVASGAGFALKHLYFWWRVPMLIPAGLGFAFIFGPVGSLPLSIISHWIGNMEPMMLYFGIRALFGLG
jgi:membrane protease YdiL (CAAX protease family)